LKTGFQLISSRKYFLNPLYFFHFQKTNYLLNLTWFSTPLCLLWRTTYHWPQKCCHTLPTPGRSVEWDRCGFWNILGLNYKGGCWQSLHWLRLSCAMLWARYAPAAKQLR